MKTFLSDIFPRIQRYSEKLDNLTLLTNQHWVSIDDIILIKSVYIFRTNSELLVSTNGIIEKGKWEYLGNKSLLIDIKTDSYLFKHGFFDENILALKLDSTEEYAVFVNENKYDGELNSIGRVLDFITQTYPFVETESVRGLIEQEYNKLKANVIPPSPSTYFKEYNTDKGIIYVRLNSEKDMPEINDAVFQNGSRAPNGRYTMDDLNYFIIDEGVIVDLTLL